MNQTVCTTIGQALSLFAFGIGLSFGLFFCIEAIVAWCKRWGKWREARRLVRQAEDSEAMKAWRASKEKSRG